MKCAKLFQGTFSEMTQALKYSNSVIIYFKPVIKDLHSEYIKTFATGYKISQT